MHSGDLLSTDNNDTSNEWNQFDYKAAVVGNSRLGEIKVKAREVMAVGASALSKAVVEFHFTGCGKHRVKELRPRPPAGGFASRLFHSFPSQRQHWALRTPNRLSMKLNHSAGMGALTCIMLTKEVYGLKTEFRWSEQRRGGWERKERIINDYRWKLIWSLYWGKQWCFYKSIRLLQ